MSKIKLSARAKKLLDKIPNCSEIIRVYEYRECVEFVVDRWGDICTFRVYENGDVAER